MGNVFRRRRQPVEELDEIVKQLRELETQLKDHIEGRADLLRTLLFAAVGLWGAGSAYGWLHFGSLGLRLAAVGAALFVAVLTFIGLRLLCITGYDFVIERKRRRIAYFTERRVTIIEDVKENEKFKVAREIIEKYGDDADLSRLHGFADMTTANPNASILPPPPNGVPKVGDAPTDGRRKSIAQPSSETDSTAVALPATPAAAPLPRLHEMTSTRRFARTPVRPFVEPSGNPLDRLLDYVMGESINNRYALICASCRAHNGMALREEFEQVAYFCFKCGVYNPSRNEMRATSGQPRRNGSPPQSFRRPSYSASNVRMPFGQASGGGPSRTPSIRSLATMAGHADLDDLDQLDTTPTTDTTTTTRHNGKDAAEETVPAEPHQPASNDRKE